MKLFFPKWHYEATWSSLSVLEKTKLPVSLQFIKPHETNHPDDEKKKMEKKACLPSRTGSALLKKVGRYILKKLLVLFYSAKDRYPPVLLLKVTSCAQKPFIGDRPEAPS